MNALYQQSASGSQKGKWFINPQENTVQFNNGLPPKNHPFSSVVVLKTPDDQYNSPQYRNRISKSHSELVNNIHNSYPSTWMTYGQLLELYKEIFTKDKKNDEISKKLKNEIQTIYHEHQKKNWDGYGAEPLKWLPEALNFADMLLQESQDIVESVDIVPENDGCLCFEWFKSDTRLISISIEDDKLIYNYRIEDEKGCGEVNFSGSQMLIDQIKQVAGGEF